MRGSKRARMSDARYSRGLLAFRAQECEDAEDIVIHYLIPDSGELATEPAVRNELVRLPGIWASHLQLREELGSIWRVSGARAFSEFFLCEEAPRKGNGAAWEKGCAWMTQEQAVAKLSDVRDRNAVVQAERRILE